MLELIKEEEILTISIVKNLRIKINGFESYLNKKYKNNKKKK
jgi:hypothetical protein